VPPDHRQEVEAAVKLLQSWAADDDSEPRKLVYLLEHHYTQAALSFGALKGAARATVLRGAAPRAGCALHLGIVHIEESGWAEHTDYGGGYYSHRRRFYRDWSEDDNGGDDEESDDAAFEIGEVCDGGYFIAQWRDAADQPVDFGEVPLDEDEVLPAAAFDDAKPDEEHLSEATGNEGASFERTYLRAALVLWPVTRFDEVCASAGLDATIARIGQLVTEAGADEDANARESRRTARERVLRFARLLPSEWPLGEEHGPRLDALLGHLARFGDAGLIEELTAPVLAKHNTMLPAAISRCSRARPCSDRRAATASSPRSSTQAQQRIGAAASTSGAAWPPEPWPDDASSWKRCSKRSSPPCPRRPNPPSPCRSRALAARSHFPTRKRSTVFC